MAGEGGTLAKEVEAEGEDLDKLETELDQMAAEIPESGATLPNLLSSTMSSILGSRTLRSRCARVMNQVRQFPFVQGRECEEQAVEEKARLVKEKMGRNASEMRVVVERLRECAARTKKLRSSSYSSACNGICNSIIHTLLLRRGKSSTNLHTMQILLYSWVLLFPYYMVLVTSYNSQILNLGTLSNIPRLLTLSRIRGLSL